MYTTGSSLPVLTAHALLLAGTKPSATVQPFTIVQLDISGEAVKSVEDALQQFAAPETLDGYRTKGKTEVAASKLLKIQVGALSVLHPLLVDCC